MPTEAPPLRRWPGDPNPQVTGQIVWGAAVGGNTDPASKHEQAGEILAIRRTFWGTNQPATGDPDFASTVQADHAVGRFPWVSIKFADWAAAASGAEDAVMDNVIRYIETECTKPVALIINHEPENDGGDSGSGWEATAGANYRGMQQRFKQRMDAWEAANGARQNLSFHGCLMYYTWNPVSGRDPAAWYPGAGIWDTVGNDHYTENINDNVLRDVWNNYVTWCEARGETMSLPEWGIRGEDPDGPAQMQSIIDVARVEGRDLTLFAYFDSSLNSTGSGWELDNENGLLDKFHQVQAANYTVTLAGMGY